MKGIDKIRERILELRAMEITAHAAHASYFIVLSLFPTLVLLLGLLRYTRLQAADLMEMVGGFIPEALQTHAWNLISETYRSTSRVVLSVSALTALWSAGKGIYGLMKGLNNIYGVRERRGWFRTRLMCALYMVLFILVLILTLVLYVFGTTISEFLRLRGGGFWILADLSNLRFFLLVAVQSLLFCVMFMYLPGENNGFRESLPGALFASLGWMGISTLFSWYVEHFSGYASVFGSVYAVALSMLWLYLCVQAVFWGAVVNKIVRKRNQRKIID